jgi:hypothetical protein
VDVLATRLSQHIFDEHRNHCFVLCEENTIPMRHGHEIIREVLALLLQERSVDLTYRAVGLIFQTGIAVESALDEARSECCLRSQQVSFPAPRTEVAVGRIL